MTTPGTLPRVPAHDDHTDASFDGRFQKRSTRQASATQTTPTAGGNPNLFLVLNAHWFDETEAGRKRVEYRTLQIEEESGKRRASKWVRDIWLRRDEIKSVTFARGMTKRRLTFAVVKIDLGPCPIEGWAGEYIRIHFTEVAK